jgi:hypothetical protein
MVSTARLITYGTGATGTLLLLGMLAGCGPGSSVPVATLKSIASLLLP